MKFRGLALAGCIALLPALPQAAPLALGWVAEDATHPTLGPLRFAFNGTMVVTPVGNANVYSRAYVSCARNSRKLTIELTSTVSPDKADGLRPRSMPTLMCTKAGRQETLVPRWEVSQNGDALARDLTASSLRECTSIDVAQEIELPQGWARESVPVTFAIAPSGRELASVLAACGGASVAAAPSSPAPSSDATWTPARVVSTGKTNVRAGPSTQSALVTQLHPGMTLQAQKADGDWWRIRSSPGGKLVEGYIREDRLVFK
ncbi:hypothetical protein BWI17_11040 [Betaproteobacteria bacterium GR16-43]|nr:hypothetical protein BWI17_11040 [Betaproteobacteria bacterium GR16-43]